MASKESLSDDAINKDLNRTYSEYSYFNDYNKESNVKKKKNKYL